MLHKISRQKAVAVAGVLAVAAIAVARPMWTTFTYHRQRLLVEAAGDGDLALMHRMIRLGADPRAASHGMGTALFLAATNGHLDAMRYLLDLGVDPERGNKFHFTPLMAASQRGNIEAMDLLVSRGANVNARETFDGCTALLIAAGARKPRAVAFLVAHGADPQATPERNTRE